MGAVNQVDADRLDRRAGQACEGSAGITEIGGHVDGGPFAHRAQRVVDRLGQRGRVGGDVGDQRGLVQLYPLRAVVGEQRQEFGVDRQQLLEPLDRCATAVDGLAQQQEGDRPDDHWASGNALFLSFFELGKDLGRVQREVGRGLDLGNDVVIVGVEPLGHFQRRDVLVAPRGGEVAVQIVSDSGGPRRQRAEHDRGVEHLVVVGEGIHRNRVEAGGGQCRPRVAAQRRGDGLQFRSAGAPGPVTFGRTLEFAFGADARGAGDGSGKCLRGHKFVLQSA